MSNLARLPFLSFFVEVKDELGRVIWPDRQEVVILTGQVIFVSLILAAVIGGLDYLFTYLNDLII